ncbi:MAG: lysophospholipid acyltransferase family protein, partial [bacterium]|nr:lysophospholipid acyltransferase family protein [bacterium]
LAPTILQGVAWPLARLMLDFFCHLTIRGRENLDRAVRMKEGAKGGVVFALNHTSELDPILSLVAISPLSTLFPMFYVSRDGSKYKHDAFGWRKHIYGSTFFGFWGAHSALSGWNDYKKSLGLHAELLSHGHSVCIFPEGGISKDGTLGQARGGAAFLATETDSVVVPVAVRGAWRMTNKDFFRRRRTITVTYGEPLLGRDLNLTQTSMAEQNAYRVAGQEIMGRIEDLLDDQKTKVEV